MRLSSMRVGLEFNDPACMLSRVPLFATHGLQPSRLLCPWDFPGENTGVGCHFLVQRIFLAQGSNLPLLSLLLQQADSLLMCDLGSPNSMMSVLKKDSRDRTHTHTYTGACRQG